MTTLSPDTNWPGQQLHRQLNSLEMRFVRELSKNPWHCEYLEFDENPWHDLHDERYELNWSLHSPGIEILTDTLKQNLSIYDTQYFPAVEDD